MEKESDAILLVNDDTPEQEGRSEVKEATVKPKKKKKAAKAPGLVAKVVSAVRAAAAATDAKSKAAEKKAPKATVKVKVKAAAPPKATKKPAKPVVKKAAAPKAKRTTKPVGKKRSRPAVKAKSKKTVGKQRVGRPLVDKKRTPMGALLSMSRARRGLSAQQLAKHLKVTPQAVSAWENLRRLNVPSHRLPVISKVLHIPMKTLQRTQLEQAAQAKRRRSA